MEKTYFVNKHLNKKNMNNLTPSELEMLDQCQSSKQWNDACDKIKAARNGNYPDDWWAVMKLSGKMDEILARWGSDSSLKVESF